MMTRCRPFLAGLGLAAALAGGAARAATLEVAPVSHELSAARPALSMTVTNRGHAPATLQVRGFAWTQDDGEDRLLPAAELMVSPPIFKLAPGATQVVRALVQGAASERERSYRLLIDELPDDADGVAVRVALRLSVPVFVKPAGPGGPQLDWALSADARGVRIDNRGGSYQRVHQLSVLTADGRSLDAASPGPYVLAGAQRRWSLGAAAATLRPGDTVRLSALTDGGRVEVPLVVGP